MIDTATIYREASAIGPSIAAIGRAFEGTYDRYEGPELEALRHVAPEFGYDGRRQFSAAWHDGKRPCTIVVVLDGVVAFAFQEVPRTATLDPEEIEELCRAQCRGLLEARRKGWWPRFKKRRAS